MFFPCVEVKVVSPAFSYIVRIHYKLPSKFRLIMYEFLQLAIVELRAIKPEGNSVPTTSVTDQRNMLPMKETYRIIERIRPYYDCMIPDWRHSDPKSPRRYFSFSLEERPEVGLSTPPSQLSD